MRKQKILLVSLVLLCLAVFGIIYGAATLFIQKEYINIEQRESQQNVARAIDALNNQIDELGSKSTVWSSWDDTYTFINDKNQAYVDSNLTDSSLEGMNVDYLLYFDAAGNLSYQNVTSAVDRGLKPLTASSENFWRGSNILTTSADMTRKGIIVIDQKPLLFFSRPILTSNGEGPIRGTLVFARFLSKDDSTEVSKLTRLQTSYYGIEADSLPQAIKQRQTLLRSDRSVIVRVDNKQLNGYQFINDIYGKPAVVVATNQPRDTFAQTQRAFTYFMTAVLSILIVVSIVIAYIFRQLAAKDEIIRLKDDFFSIASHEIRTPLIAIKGNAQLLSQMYGEKNGQGFIEITDDIRTSGERLIRLVTNFLDAARLEQGKMTTNPENVTLKILVQQVVNELQGIANEKNISVLNGIDDGSLRGYADKDHLKQVLYNLIGNALKFTDQGSIRVTAQLESESVRLYITDTGRGVPASGKEALFRKFEQTQKGDAVKGTGLGLYISKMLVERMGGAIRLESSEEGVGTVISFDVPAAESIET